MAAANALIVEPEGPLSFVFKREDQVQLLKITSKLPDRIAFKVKCSWNETIRIRPPIGLLRTNQQATVSLIINTSGQPFPRNKDGHFIAVYFAKVAEDSRNILQIWKEKKEPFDLVKKMYIEFKQEEKQEINDDETGGKVDESGVEDGKQDPVEF